MRQNIKTYLNAFEKKNEFQVKQGVNNQEVIRQHPHRVWPYWVNQQFNPTSTDFTCLATPYAATNITNRNWTLLGFPFTDKKIIVDPTGMITPLNELWSLEIWVSINNELYIASQCKNIKQFLSKSSPKLLTRYKLDALKIDSEVFFNPLTEQENLCINQVTIENTSSSKLNLQFFYVIRPYSPEGVSSIHSICYLSNASFMVNHKLSLVLDKKPDNIICAPFSDQDLSEIWSKWEMILSTECPDKQLASALASYKLSLNPDENVTFSSKIPLLDYSLFGPSLFSKPNKAENSKKLQKQISQFQSLNASHESSHISFKWEELLKNKLKLKLPDNKLEKQFKDSCFHVLNFTTKESILGSILPKNNSIETTYQAFLALNQLGFAYRSARYIKEIPTLNKWALMQLRTITQKAKTILCIYHTSMYTSELSLDKYFNKCHFLGKTLPSQIKALNTSHSLSDYIWVLSAFKALSEMAKTCKKETLYTLYQNKFSILKHNIEQISKHTAEINQIKPFFPINSSILKDSRLIENLEALLSINSHEYDQTMFQNTISVLEKCLVKNKVFNFQDTIGFSTVSNMTLAQAYLACKNEKAFELITWLSKVSTGTTNWPEAIHPQKYTGSAGNGHHLASSAKFINLILDQIISIRERSIHLLPFVPPNWLNNGEIIECNNYPTPFGIISFFVISSENSSKISWKTNFSTAPKDIVICSPKPLVKYSVDKKEYKTNKKTLTLPIQVSSIELFYA